jgi:hypothetical protein
VLVHTAPDLHVEWRAGELAAQSGTSQFSAGTYSSFHVKALGNWTIKIQPNC